MNLIFILITTLITLFSKSNTGNTVITTTPAEVADQPAQYGTPYTQVPAPSDAIIYQVNTRAFSASGKFQGIIDRLDAIKDLGVNVIYLMPVYPVGTTKAVNSPYCIKDYETVAAEFGSLDDLRNLVSKAHAKKMAIIFDWVANHTSWDHPWVSANKAWYSQDTNGNIISPPGTGWDDVAQLNFANTDMRKAMIKAMKYWIYAANIDGYRCDAADFVPADFWKQAIDSLRKINTHQLLLFAEGTRNDHFAAGFQLEYGMGFYNTLKNRVAAGGPITAIDSINKIEYSGATAQSQVVRYISNHDIDLSDGTPAELFGGNNGSLAAFVVAAYLKGVPMIYNGQEIGYNVRLDYFNNSTPIKWTTNSSVTDAYKKLLAFRAGSAAVKTGTLKSYSSNDVCVFSKTAGTDKVLVLSNLRNSKVNYSIPAAIATTWKNALGTGQTALSKTIALAPYQYMVLKN